MENAARPRRPLRRALALVVTSALVVAACGGGSEDAASAPTPAEVALTDVDEPTATPEPEPTATPEPSPTPEVDRDPALPLFDCFTEEPVEVPDGERLALSKSDDRLTVHSARGDFVADIPCAIAAGELTRVGPGWYLLGLESAATASITISDGELTIADVLDDDGQLRNPSQYAKGFGRGDDLLVLPGVHDTLVLNGSTGTVTPLPAEMFRITTDRFEIANGNAVAAAGTDSGAWLFDPLDPTAGAVEIAESGSPRLNRSGNRAVVSTWGDDGRELRWVDTANGELVWVLPAADVAAFQPIGENLLVLDGTGLAIVDDSGELSPYLRQGEVQIFASSVAQAHVLIANADGTGSALVAADGSIEAVPELDGLLVLDELWTRPASHLVLWASEARPGDDVVTLDLDAGVVHGWDLGDEGRASLIRPLQPENWAAMYFLDAAVVFRPDRPQPVLLEALQEGEFGQTILFIDSSNELGLATSSDSGMVTVYDVVTGSVLSELEEGQALGWLEAD